jgi:hypothetical protein
MFDREVDPSSGQYTMFLKLGNNQKFYGDTPMKTSPTPIQQQAMYMQDQFSKNPLDDAYGAYMSTIPKSKEAISNDVGIKTGLYDEMDSINQQKMAILRSMTGDQSAIFNATNPDGTPIDPRIKIAQYKANMASLTDRSNQLRDLETVYKGQLKTLTDAEYNRAQAENEKAKTALLYLKDLTDQQNTDREFQLKQQQLQQNQSQFQQDQQYKYDALGKPELKQDASGAWNWTTPPTPSSQQ